MIVQRRVRWIGSASVVVCGLLTASDARLSGHLNCPPDRSMQAGVRHRALVADYRREDPVLPVQTATRLTSRNLDDVLAGAFSPRACRDDPPWTSAEIRAAAMMHADAAESLLLRQSLEPMMVQLRSGRRFLQHLGVDSRPFAERWYVAVSQRLRLAGLVSPWAAELLMWAREDVPDSARILFESGRVAELSAAGASSLQLGPRASPIPAVRNRERERFYRAALADGIRWLRQAVALDAGNAWASLHLARLLLALEKDPDAVRLLETLITRVPERDVLYVARLFQGMALERLGQIDEAIGAYDEAIGLFPHAQAAYFLSSAVLAKDGRAAEARRKLASLHAHQSTPPAEDPWWKYLFDTRDRVQQALTALRDEVRR